MNFIVRFSCTYRAAGARRCAIHRPILNVAQTSAIFLNISKKSRNLHNTTPTPKVTRCHLVMSGIIGAHGMRQSPFRHFFRRFVIFRPSQSYYDGNRDCDTSFTTGTGMSQLIVLGVIVAIMEKKFAIGIFVLSHIYR